MKTKSQRKNITQHPDPTTLLTWYDSQGRDLPWRPAPNQAPHLNAEGAVLDPYKVWLSEIMLQQTTVAAVKPYFLKFLEKWPTVVDFANAPLEDILRSWAGLGYYARARNMHKCALIIAKDMNGRFPDTEADLLKLPGIGPYTAAAIVAIAFNRPATVVDGNVERVMARHYQVDTPLPQSKNELKSLAQALTPPHRPGDYAQAIMDLGATICTPRNPSCLICPWSSTCQVKDGDPTEYPKKTPKSAKPTRSGFVIWCETDQGNVYLERRPAKGLLGGMLGFPGNAWTENKPTTASDYFSSFDINITPLEQTVRHTFTHFHLDLHILPLSEEAFLKTPFYHADTAHTVPKTDLLDVGLPTVMQKIAQIILKS